MKTRNLIAAIVMLCLILPLMLNEALRAVLKEKVDGLRSVVATLIADHSGKNTGNVPPRITAVTIDFSGITQDNLKDFWERLDVTRPPDPYKKNVYIEYFSQRFYDDVTRPNNRPATIDCIIGEERTIAGEKVNTAGTPQGLNRIVPALYRVTDAKGYRYVFNGINNNCKLHDCIGWLKALGFPLENIRIENTRSFDLRNHYRNTLKGRFTGSSYAILALNGFAEMIDIRLQEDGWKVNEDIESRTHKYTIYTKFSRSLVLVNLSGMNGDAASLFIDELYDQGIKNFVFWGTAGSLDASLAYFDSMSVSDVTHVNNSLPVRVPPNVRFSETIDHTGRIVDDYSLIQDTDKYLRRNASEKPLAVEMELYHLFKWLAQHKDAKCDVYLNISNGIGIDFRPGTGKRERAQKERLYEEKCTRAEEGRLNEIGKRLDDFLAAKT